MLFGVFVPLALAVASCLYAVNAYRGKGPLLSSIYLGLSKDEKADFDKGREYKRISALYFCLTVVFVITACYSYFQISWIAYALAVAAVLTILYGLTSHKRAQTYILGKHGYEESTRVWTYSKFSYDLKPPSSGNKRKK
ncbi:MAG: DUF3784 domain-containing protein [Oscillospiraceae bacterium]|nr:DUF3784 domain-containing protein [Oscillospiraceae bacterium]